MILEIKISFLLIGCDINRKMLISIIILMVVFGCIYHLICCLSLLLVPVLAPISVNGSCFSIYFPTFTSFFPPSP